MPAAAFRACEIDGRDRPAQRAEPVGNDVARKPRVRLVVEPARRHHRRQQFVAAHRQEIVDGDLQNVLVLEVGPEPVGQGLDLGGLRECSGLGDNFAGFARCLIAVARAEAPNALIAAFWDDLNPGAGGEVFVETRGEAPSRRFIAQWTEVPRFPDEGSHTFQAVLFEGTDDIELRYGALTGSSGSEGGSATVGLEGRLGERAVQVSCNEDALSAGQSIRFTRARACSDRTTAPCSIPGKSRSST